MTETEKPLHEWSWEEDGHRYRLMDGGVLCTIEIAPLLREILRLARRVKDLEAKANEAPKEVMPHDPDLGRGARGVQVASPPPPPSEPLPARGFSDLVLCRCGHTREWHDSYSDDCHAGTCNCQQFARSEPVTVMASGGPHTSETLAAMQEIGEAAARKVWGVEPSPSGGGDLCVCGHKMTEHKMTDHYYLAAGQLRGRCCRAECECMSFRPAPTPPVANDSQGGPRPLVTAKSDQAASAAPQRVPETEAPSIPAAPPVASGGGETLERYQWRFPRKGTVDGEYFVERGIDGGLVSGWRPVGYLDWYTLSPGRVKDNEILRLARVAAEAQAAVNERDRLREELNAATEHYSRTNDERHRLREEIASRVRAACETRDDLATVILARDAAERRVKEIEDTLASIGAIRRELERDVQSIGAERNNLRAALAKAERRVKELEDGWDQMHEKLAWAIRQEGESSRLLRALVEALNECLECDAPATQSVDGLTSGIALCDEHKHAGYTDLPYAPALRAAQAHLGKGGR